MTTKQAIHLLHRLQDEQFDGPHGDERREALSMAVRALSGDGDTIYRQDVLKILSSKNAAWDAYDKVKQLPSAQPEIIRCKDCIYYDPPHVKNNGVRYEYDEMPADAFDALGTGLVNAEYGINIGGRCCVDYYCKNYSDDKRVFVREDNYCGRAERRTDGSD